MRSNRFQTNLLMLTLVTATFAYPAVAQDQDPRKDATDATKAANAAAQRVAVLRHAPTSTTRSAGFIAPLPSEVIKGAGRQHDLEPAAVRLHQAEDAAAPDTVNPSLWRQSQLINLSGLFEVADGIYQVRNLDLSNMTIIEGTRRHHRRRPAGLGGDREGRPRSLLRQPRRRSRSRR